MTKGHKKTFGMRVIFILVIVVMVPRSKHICQTSSVGHLKSIPILFFNKGVCVCVCVSV